MTLAAVDGSTSAFVHVADIVEYSLLLISCMLLIAYLRRNRHSALRGDPGAARKLILPAFEPLLWSLSAAMSLLLATAATYLAILDNQPISQMMYVAEGEHAVRQFAQLLVPVFLLHKSVSLPALRRSALLTIVLASYTLLLVWVLDCFASGGDQWSLPLARLAILGFYLYLALNPSVRASKRSVREYCTFAAIYHVLLFTSSMAFLFSSSSAGSVLLFAAIVWSSLLPIVVWRVLKADTEHWRGLGQRACALQRDLRLRLARQPRSGSGIGSHLHERISSQGLHVLIEMHRKFLIDFAYLEIRERIGIGSSATVFRGVLHWRTDVAVKVYTPTDFTDEIVAAFSHEAALCGSLRHPNVVRFVGMCILPPTICLVSELCVGSLDDVLKALTRSEKRKRARNPGKKRELFAEISYMLDAARAVAYLHSFSPPFLHRDIKPSNFLVDSRHSVKLTDFGESRSLPRGQNHTHITSRRQQPTLPARAHETSDGYSSENATTATSGSAVTPDGARRMTVRGTVDYMAPELISGRAGTALYAEAADIYALGITLWDIVFPTREKFPKLANSHLAVFEAVLRGHRPQFEDGSDDQPHVPRALRELIERTWHESASCRPTAMRIVSELERIQEQVLAEFVLRDIAQSRTETTGMGAHNDRGGQMWTGEALAKVLEATGVVRTSGEAVRLGNALMDAGMLHHWKHSAGFDPSAQHNYFIDETEARVLRSLAPLNLGSKASSSSSLVVATGSLDEGVEQDKGDGLVDTTEPRLHKASGDRHRFRYRLHRGRLPGVSDTGESSQPRRHRHGIEDLVDLLGRVNLRGDHRDFYHELRVMPSPRHFHPIEVEAEYRPYADPLCACRRLGQGIEKHRASKGSSDGGLKGSRWRERRFRGRLTTTTEAPAEEASDDQDALTTELLTRDAEPEEEFEEDEDEAEERADPAEAACLAV